MTQPVDSSLPKLLYVGDVAVESTMAGSTLLYRLMQSYPADRIRIAQGSLFGSKPEARIPGVKYDELHYGHRRPLLSRFAPIYSGYLMSRCNAMEQLRVIAKEFRPDAIVTVAHRFLWRSAAKLAAELRVPLHLIVHDDVRHMGHTPSAMESWVAKSFRKTFQQAASRLCVSPFMAESYSKEFGARADVLYPSRAANAPIFDSPPERSTREGLVFAYAGSVNSAGYANCLTSLADAAAARRGKLLIYSTLSPQSSLGQKLNPAHVTIHPPLPFHELALRLREQVDVLFAPMSFEADERRNMEIGFPSKLVDYTSVGLPMLIVGPAYCSAVRWARENPDVAEVVDQPGLNAIVSAVARLSDAGRRETLARRALQVGREQFSYESAVGQFHAALRRGGAAG